MSYYGEPPVPVGEGDLDEWTEFMHYLYLPVRMAGDGRTRLPRRLSFAMIPVLAAMDDYEHALGGDIRDRYVYVTARRGYATPDNPLNRPGWHCDGFGTDDVNYTWCDEFPTRIALQSFDGISTDHIVSMRQFDEQVQHACVVEVEKRVFYRLSPFVVHTTPIIPRPGAMRSFLKVSVSRHRYNLIGNSHNHQFAYNWKMHPRDAARNDPAGYMADFVED